MSENETPWGGGAQPLLMRCSVDDLRRKLGNPKSPLAARWRHFLTLSRREPDWFASYTVLAALVTNEEDDRARARRAFLRFVELAEEGRRSNEAQGHTHVMAAPLGRWAIFYDWMAEIGLFSDGEDAAIRATMLDHAFVFPLQGLQARIRSFDNQILSNAFGAAAVGYVFGVKRGNSALGRRLFGTGLNWLREMLNLLPPGGYSPEGSTYQEHVVLPMALLSALLFEETTGIAAMQEGVPPRCLPVRKILETSYRLIGPAGLWPGWDDHGFHAATVKSSLAYLARLQGDGRPLGTVDQACMWYRTALPAWEADDRLWTLVWWPENREAAPPHFDAWMEEAVGGALQTVKNRLRLFQYWDECPGVPHAGRGQVNPNAITLEAFGSPLLVDGLGELSPATLPLTDAARDYVGERMLETIREYRGGMNDEDALRLALAGSIGMSNSLIIDGEIWYVPRDPCVGRGMAVHSAGPLQALRSDATAYYTDRYDVRQVERSSVLVDGRYALVCDRVVSDSPRALTWQAFVRAEARVEDGRIRIETPERVHCDVIPLQPGGLQLTPTPEFPKATIPGSLRVHHTVPASTDARLDVALIPQSGLKLLEDLTDGWRRLIGERSDAVSLGTAYLTDPATERERSREFRRSVSLQKDPEARYFLEVGLAPGALELEINGRTVAPVFEQKKGIWPESAAFLPHVFEVTEALIDGENELRLAAPYFHGESIAGPVRLQIAVPPLPVKVERIGEDCFRVSVGGRTDDIIVERSGEGPWLEGSTDARYAVRTADGTIAAMDVTTLHLPDSPSLRAQAPCDVAWSPVGTQLSRYIAGTSLELVWAQGRLRIECAGCLEISYAGEGAHRLQVKWPAGLPVVVNGELHKASEPDADGMLTLDLPSGQPIIETPRTVDDLYALGARAGALAAPEVLKALQGDDWRMQIAAADLAGRLGIREAVPILLDLFMVGEAELPYPPLRYWWSWSKMLMQHRPEGHDPDLPLPLGIKRWRVKRAVVTALGLLGDRRAVAPIEAALTRCDDFFTVTSQMTVALGRLGSSSSISVLERHEHHAEVNTRIHARLSLQLLRGEISRAEFEDGVGLQ